VYCARVNLRNDGQSGSKPCSFVQEISGYEMGYCEEFGLQLLYFDCKWLPGGIQNRHGTFFEVKTSLYSEPARVLRLISGPQLLSVGFCRLAC
jgi:hypothetical protein